MEVVALDCAKSMYYVELCCPPVGVKFDQSCVSTSSAKFRNKKIGAEGADERYQGIAYLAKTAFVGSAEELDEAGLSTYFRVLNQHSFHDQAAQAMANED